MKKKYKINEIFGPTIQGEGSNTGMVVSFVRFSGCNKKCPFCDTNHQKGKLLTIEEIINKLPPIVPVIFTGGEPLLQADNELINAIKETGREVWLETNGSIALNDRKFDHVSVSPKQDIWETEIEYADDLKVLYPTKWPLRDWLDMQVNNYYLQPVEGKEGMAIAETLEALYTLNYWRLSLQTHKFIGVE